MREQLRTIKVPGTQYKHRDSGDLLSQDALLQTVHGATPQFCPFPAVSFAIASRVLRSVNCDICMSTEIGWHGQLLIIAFQGSRVVDLCVGYRSHYIVGTVMGCDLILLIGVEFLLFLEKEFLTGCLSDRASRRQYLYSLRNQHPMKILRPTPT